MRTRSRISHSPVLGTLSALLIGVGAAQAQQVISVKPPHHVEMHKGPVVIVARKLPSIAEAFYLKKVADGFARGCSNRAVGCAITAVTVSGAKAEATLGDERRAPDRSPKKWTANDKITMASVSKTFTAAALLKLPQVKTISVDDKIGPHLPKHWNRTSQVDAMTFRQLLAHTSGLECNGISYDQLKACLVTATPKPSPWAYKNENYALMRMLIPQLSGIRESTLKPLVTADNAGNSTQIATTYANFYREYVNRNVFAPSGLPAMQCKVTDAIPALSYKSATTDKYDFSKVGPGDPWGDMSLFCGSQGWFLSSTQIAQAMRAIMTPGKVLSADTLKAMKADQLGVYYVDHGDGLQSWSHGGFHPAEMNKGEINTVIVHFNNGVSIGVIVNSPYGAKGTTGASIWNDLIAAVKAGES